MPDNYFTLTPALSHQGRGGSKSPLPSRERARVRGMVGNCFTLTPALSRQGSGRCVIGLLTLNRS